MDNNNNLVVLMFEGVGTASTVYSQLKELEKERFLTITDAIIIEREGEDKLVSLSPTQTFSDQGSSVSKSPRPTEESVRIVQTHSKKGKYAKGGGGLGLLAGFLLGGPVFGMAIGATVGAITAGLKDFGIDDKSIEAIKRRLQPNTSALLILGRAHDREILLAKLREYDAKLVSSTLAPEVEKELREQFTSYQNH